MIFLYNILLFIVVLPGLPLILMAILASGKLRRTFPHRMGVKPLPAAIDHPEVLIGQKGSVWIHALSVGEVLSAVPLVTALRNRVDNHRILFSVSTLTGHDVATRRLSGVVNAIFFYPYDLSFSVKYIVNKINPALVVIIETDLWPNFLHEMALRRVPVLLINARLSKKSFSGYKRFAFFFRWMFSGIAKICVQSSLDAVRFRRLGIPSERIVVTGNVKFDQNDDPIPEDRLRQWRRRLRIPPEGKVWLAGSTHDGEEAVIKEVFIRLKRNMSDLTLIAAPRDHRRASWVARLFQEAGLSTTLVSECSSSGAERSTEVIVVDTIGDLRTLYALADTAFIGGSLVDCGGHNPLEPAAFSRPVLFGPDMSDFASIAGMLLESGGALKVHDAQELFTALQLLLENSLKAEEMGQNAYRVFCENRGAVARNLEIIADALSRLETRKTK